jgi:hypothetical protein
MFGYLAPHLVQRSLRDTRSRPTSPMLVLSPNHCTSMPAWIFRRCPHWQIASTDKSYRQYSPTSDEISFFRKLIHAAHAYVCPRAHLTSEIMDRWETLVFVKKQIAEREAEVSEVGSNPQPTMQRVTLVSSVVA